MPSLRERVPVWLTGVMPPASAATNLLILGGSCLLLYLADRTTLFMKNQKQYDAWQFWGLMAATLAGGWLTRQQNKDGSFLNRHQTDEWKGWMQIVILIYHYCGASSVHGIYNCMCCICVCRGCLISWLDN